MTEAGKKATDKLNIIKNMSENADTKEVIKVLLEYIDSIEKGEAGFTPRSKK